MKKFFSFKNAKVFAVCLNALIIAAQSAAIYYGITTPDSFNVTDNETINIASVLTVENSVPCLSGGRAEMKLLNAIPVKTVDVNLVDRKTLCVGGAPFGIKMLTDGLIIVGLSDVAGETERINPAKEAGIKTGDMLISVNGIKLSSNQQLGKLVENSRGRPLKLKLSRKGEIYEKSVSPVKTAADDKYRIGIWVRDSSAGIGIMTYYDKNSGQFGGLGHPVCDVDIGEIMPLKSGEIVRTTITGCKKGVRGFPGELRGRFISMRPVGSINKNCASGVSGTISGKIPIGEELPIAFSHEVREGPATLYTTICGDTPKAYSARIEKVQNKNSRGQNMVIRITDEKLLSETGGIVQGMSGSPVIQNGRIVGAVTHVLVNDPTRGYGIFIENMLDAA